MPHRPADDHDLLSASRALLRPLVRELVEEALATIARAPALAQLHSQVDGQRPIGIGRTRYLRAWRRGHEAGDAECRADGRARVMTASAWERHGATTPTRARAPKGDPDPVRDVDVLEELGLDGRRRAG